MGVQRISLGWKVLFLFLVSNISFIQIENGRGQSPWKCMIHFEARWWFLQLQCVKLLDLVQLNHCSQKNMKMTLQVIMRIFFIFVLISSLPLKVRIVINVINKERGNKDEYAIN